MPPPESIANRYRVLETLGTGGMATVYLVLDTATQRRLALKQLRPREEEGKQEQVARLFEQEFCTLAQLAHPRVVEVYDFGTDDRSPYYTMELLDGGDLRELSPLPWQKACSLLADVCSVLSLLHSRRLVYCDLSARNVRCTRDEKAKLIDFGAMMPMGPCKHTIGTPLFVAPEVVGLQELDARADLYSLGAVLYYALTGRPGYPVRSFAELSDAWRSGLRPPSHFADDIPKELDDLVLSLMNLDPMARPTNAAEVLEKLSAIAGLTPDEQLLVSQAYLSTPMLVGRAGDILRVRKRVLQALSGRGTALFIEGPAGVGRSRFLDACVLEAKVVGATVVKADASDAHVGSWGVARALATHLVDELPQLASQTAEPYLPILYHLLPELLPQSTPGPPPPPASSGVASAEAGSAAAVASGAEDCAPTTPSLRSVPPGDMAGRFGTWRPPPQVRRADTVVQPFDDPQQLRPRLQAALCDWLLTISESRPLMIAVDDFHRIDEPSAALIARLCDELPKKTMFVAVTAQSDAPVAAPVATQLVKDCSKRVELGSLASHHTEQLLVSVFGETPNLRLLADKLQGISGGNPRALMHLAQHLVDRKLVRYQAGAWTLPNRIDAGDLPQDLAEAFKARVVALNPEARRLARAMALTPEQRLSLEECLFLSQNDDKLMLLRHLNELVTFAVVSTDGHFYSLAQQGWVAPLLDDLDDEDKRDLHLKIAEICSRRGSNAVHVATHLFAAGEHDRALDILIRDAESSQKNLVQNTEAFYDYLHSLPPNWSDTYKTALRLCQELGRPRKQTFLLQMSLIRFSIIAGLQDISILHDVAAQLDRDSGLAFYRELGESVDAETRLSRALQLAQQQYDETPEAERVLPPGDAIAQLASAISYVMGTASNAHDRSIVEVMPSLAPLEPLSPALGVVERVLNAGRHLLAARHDQAVDEIRAILDRIAQPDHAGLEDTIHRITHFSWALAIGVIEASFGLESSLKWADEIEQDALHQVNAWQIRMMYHVRQGNSEKAEQCKKHMEMLRIQNSPAEHFGNTHLFPQLLAYGLADDLLRVKGLLPDIEAVARRFPNWVPNLHFARGEYQRIRCDYRRALEEFQQALSLIAPGRHILWPYVAGAHLGVLVELESFSEGKEIGQRYLLAAQREDIRHGGTFIEMPLALIHAGLAEYETAIGLADAVVEKCRAMGTTGLNLGVAYETRARVAIPMGEEKAFAEYARLCAEQYHSGHNAALTAKYQRLVQQARRYEIRVSDGLVHAADMDDRGTQSVFTAVSTALKDSQGPQDRMRRALELLVTRSNCLGGFLYTVQERGPLLCCQHGNCIPPANMDTVARNHLQAQVDESSDATMTVADLQAAPASRSDWTNDSGDEFHSVLLSHETEDGFWITGLAVLLPDRSKGFVFPAEVAAMLSKVLLEGGDVTGVVTAS